MADDVRCPNCEVKDSRTANIKGILSDLYYRECQNCGILFNPDIAKKQMPEFLIEFLENLSDDQAESLWTYLDGSKHPITNEMVTIVCESHRGMLQATWEKE